MALESVDPVKLSTKVASSGSARMIERAHKGVVQVRSGGRGAGAGVIWCTDGLVLTNHHVAARRRRGGKTRVVLHDGRAFEAEVAKRGRNLDLALLNIKDSPGNLSSAPVGDSDALRVGELAYAIGHPWGRLGAVTAGIVSGLGVVHGPFGGRHTSSRTSRSRRGTRVVRSLIPEAR